MNGINPWLQTHWDWRAAGNFIAGGTGCGLLLINVVASLQGALAAELTLLSLGLVTIGLGLVWMELGRPWRFLHVFFNPHTSWMTREAIIALPLLVLGLAGAITNQAGPVWTAAIVGVAFLYCQGRILIAAKGIPVWRTPRIMGLILTSGIAEGCGVYLLLVPWLAPDVAAETFPFALILLLTFVTGRFAAWWVYRDGLTGKAPRAAIKELNRWNSAFITTGHIIPMLAVLFGLFFPRAQLACGLVAALSAAGAGWFIKAIIITRAAFNQGYAIEHAPARGAGHSGPGAKPGWD